ncbi:MAG: carbamoyltransferase HypF [Gemmatimonadota bacterium]|nr:carbamoyltransferase HypF [Gemmatimonadota bacterium]
MTADHSPGGHEAVQVSVTGVVQGVGFRPFVHRLAQRYRLGGWVRNEAGEVRIEVEGPSADVQAFVNALRKEAPPLTQIDAVEITRSSVKHWTEFQIVPSQDQPDRRQSVSPDVALCAECERELFDPANRRHRYPFITCTNCGPRFTVIEAMPYDRARTSMGVFQQCSACLREYDEPSDRRYHSESNSCSLCGPRVWLEVPGRESAAEEGVAAIEGAAHALATGRIVAIRGLGGFHLAVDATDEAAVVRLRERKVREAKPLAVMVRTIDEAMQLGAVSEAEEQLLGSHERPVVLLRTVRSSWLAPSVAPGLDTTGVMTAYTPLHQLLLDIVQRPLVMTSGNMSEEPIATSNADARTRLADIADAFLLHDREIVARYDDSVVRTVDDIPLFLRRARGYAPLPLLIPVATPVPLVAVGPHLKNTFTVVHGETAYVSQHIGDLENLETLTHFRESLDLFRRLFRLEPRVAVRDLHPGYLSTRVADDLGLDHVMAVQHHHAHVAAVMAEHGRTERVVGIAYDGTGYGQDGAVWGAETLTADLCTYERVGQLRYAPLPGGDLAVRRPWRVALGYLSLEPSEREAFARAFDGIDETECSLAKQQIGRGLNSPLASSMGRLFDAAAAVLGTRQVAYYEGQAAMELEALAGERDALPLPFPLQEEDGRVILDPIPLLVALGERRKAGDEVTDLAARFHESVAAATIELARRVADGTGLSTVALGGGVFQNARLLSAVKRGLEENILEVLIPRRLSPNDGSISYGQAASAAARLARDESS